MIKNFVDFDSDDEVQDPDYVIDHEVSDHTLPGKNYTFYYVLITYLIHNSRISYWYNK